MLATHFSLIMAILWELLSRPGVHGVHTTQSVGRERTSLKIMNKFLFNNDVPFFQKVDHYEPTTKDFTVFQQCTLGFNLYSSKNFVNIDRLLIWGGFI